MEPHDLTYDSPKAALDRVIALACDLQRAGRHVTRAEIFQAISGTLDLRAPDDELLPLRRSRNR